MPSVLAVSTCQLSETMGRGGCVGDSSCEWDLWPLGLSVSLFTALTAWFPVTKRSVAWLNREPDQEKEWSVCHH